MKCLQSLLDDYETDTEKLSSTQVHLCEEIWLVFEKRPLFSGDLRAKVVVSASLGTNCKLGAYRQQQAVVFNTVIFIIRNACDLTADGPAGFQPCVLF